MEPFPPKAGRRAKGGMTDSGLGSPLGQPQRSSARRVEAGQNDGAVGQRRKTEGKMGLAASTSFCISSLE